VAVCRYLSSPFLREKLANPPCTSFPRVSSCVAVIGVGMQAVATDKYWASRSCVGVRNGLTQSKNNISCQDGRVGCTQFAVLL
jgi:hypothetical protein